MVFDREDLIGLLLLGLCAIAGTLLVISIVTGTRLHYAGPSWLGVVVMLLFLGGVIYGVASGGRRRWPDPMSGRGRRFRWPWRRGQDDR